MRVPRIAGVLALCLCGSPCWAAVADYLGKPIGSVRLAIEGRATDDPTLAQMVETAVDQPLSMTAVRESVTHLFSLGRFEGVSVDAVLDGGRVALRYELTPIHPVTGIRFGGDAGAPGVDTRAFRRAIADRYGATPPVGRAADMARTVEGMLAERGYLHAQVTPQAEIQHAPERASLVFTIDPKVRTTIGTVEIVGRPTVPQPEFIRRLGLTEGAPYERNKMNENIERYVSERRSRGYYEARVVPTVTLADGDRVANLTVNVDSGPRVRVVFAGDALPSDRRDELVPIEREGSADEDLLEDSSNRIEEYFRAQGYPNASAHHTRVDADGELLITFSIAKGAQYRVTAYDISGNVSIPLAELLPGLKIRADQPFAESRLDADVTALEMLYRRRGFATVRARSAVEPDTALATPTLVPVAVRIAIAEGVRTVVESVAFEGNTALDAAALRARIGLQIDGPYVPGQVAIDRDGIEVAYQNLGYLNVTVEATPTFSADQTRASVRFQIQEGSKILVDHVLIVGNVRTRTDIIEQELRVKPGDPYSLAAIDAGQRRLTALGLFRRVRVSEVRHGAETARDLLVTVEEAAPTTIGYGGGFEAGRVVINQGGQAQEQFDIAPRASFDYGRRNLFGKNRSFNLFTSISRSVSYSLITQYEVVATFREPRLFDTGADAFINGTVQQLHRSSFDFKRRSFSTDVQRRLAGPYRVTGTYQLQRTAVFNNQAPPDQLPIIDRAFPQFLLSSFSGSVIRDTRDDPVDTHDGSYTSANAQLAARAIGSEIGFVKSYYTAQLFRRLQHSQIVFAGNARLGMATGFSTADNQLPASERFFAGGDTTNRGFPIDQLGVQHIPPQPGDTIDSNGFAIGGNGLLLFNGELRVPVTGGLGIVGFVDTGNVFARVSDIDFAELRTAVGTGLRYKSPIGPLRFDLGVKVNRLPTEGRTAWFVSFGQAF